MPQAPNCDNAPDPAARDAMESSLARLRSHINERETLMAQAVSRMQQAARAFAAYRASITEVLRAHQIIVRGGGSARALAESLDSFAGLAILQARQATSLSGILANIPGDLDALEKHGSELPGLSSEIMALANTSCRALLAYEIALPGEARNYAQASRRSLAGVREITDAALVGFVAVPALAPYLDEETTRFQGGAGTRLQRNRLDQERTNRDQLTHERLFRDRLDAARARLGRLESSIASAPARLAAEFPRSPGLNSSSRN